MLFTKTERIFRENKPEAELLGSAPQTYLVPLGRKCLRPRLLHCLTL